MALSTPARPRNTAELSLPPPFTAVRLRELGDAFQHAMAVAEQEGAGTLVYVGRFDLAEFAVVLEPDEPLIQARRVFYAGMVALTDALSAFAQPETSVTIEWPDSILVNGGLVGGAQLAWPQNVADDETPPWLVFGAAIRTVSMTDEDPGLNPLVTALEAEGFTDVLSNQVVESFARHFMLAMDSWHEGGFGAVAKNYLARLSAIEGGKRAIDENGDLLIRRSNTAGIEREALLPRLAHPAWRDADSKGPRT